MKEKKYAEGFEGSEKKVQFLAVGFLEKIGKDGKKTLEIDCILNDKPEFS